MQKYGTAVTRDAFDLMKTLENFVAGKYEILKGRINIYRLQVLRYLSCERSKTSPYFLKKQKLCCTI
jgi:hypothetical protein